MLIGRCHRLPSVDPQDLVFVLYKKKKIYFCIRLLLLLIIFDKSIKLIRYPIQFNYLLFYEFYKILPQILLIISICLYVGQGLLSFNSDILAYFYSRVSDSEKISLSGIISGISHRHVILDQDYQSKLEI